MNSSIWWEEKDRNISGLEEKLEEGRLLGLLDGDITEWPGLKQEAWASHSLITERETNSVWQYSTTSTRMESGSTTFPVITRNPSYAKPRLNPKSER